MKKDKSAKIASFFIWFSSRSHLYLRQVQVLRDLAGN